MEGHSTTGGRGVTARLTSPRNEGGNLKLNAGEDIGVSYRTASLPGADTDARVCLKGTFGGSTRGV